MAHTSVGRVAAILEEASALLGEGPVALRVHSLPVVEHVFLELLDGQLVVSDDGETFEHIAGLRGGTDEYVGWSTEQAVVAADRFDVTLVDEGEPASPDGKRGYAAFRLTRAVRPEESVADVVQSVARAIDGVLALHTRTTAASHGSYFWDYDDPEPDA